MDRYDQCLITVTSFYVWALQCVYGRNVESLFLSPGKAAKTANDAIKRMMSEDCKQKD
jgi:hypothetical protein